MDYPKPFTITVDGVPIARNKDNGKSQRMAELGNEPAVFMLQNAKLRCIDGYVLARPQTEDLSLIPKPLCWFKDDAAYRTQPTYINQNDGTPALSFGGITTLTAVHNNPRVDLVRHSPRAVRINPVQ